jgi:5-methyltetrahydropteroyltriglutamate--homocysteine methyltransferase
VGRFYVQLASDKDPVRVLEIIGRHMQPGQTVFVGVIDPIDPTIETPAQVRERVLLAARFLPAAQFGTTDDCGFAPFADDTSTSREIAFAKVRARVEGTQLAAQVLQ